MMQFHHRVLTAFNLLLAAAAPALAQTTAGPEGEWTDFSAGNAMKASPVLDEPEARAPALIGAEDFQPGEADAANPAGPAFRIGSVLVDASASVDHAIFEKAIEPFLGLEASSEDLSKLAQEIAEAARSNGMVLATAHIPEQQIELGILRVVLRIGVIDEVRIEGSTNQALTALFEPLVGHVVVQRELERALMLSNDIPAVRVSEAEFVNEGGVFVLVVRAEDQPALRGQAVIDNFGSRQIGPLRGRIKLETLGWLSDSDALSATVQTNPADEEEFLSASLVYSIGLNNNGTRAGGMLATSRSNIASSLNFDSREISTQYVSMLINHPLRRMRGSSAWLEGQIEYLEVEQATATSVLASDTIVTLSASLATAARVQNGWLRSGVQLRQGLDILRSDTPGSPPSSRTDADGEFTSARAWINWSGKPHADWTLRMALSGQLAAEPLLSPEEIGAGGMFTGRGFDPYAIYGDHGLLAFAELGYEFNDLSTWVDRVQPYTFLDGGYVDQMNDGFGGGELMSGGGGFRADFGRIGLQVETAVPIHQEGTGTDKREPRVNFQLGLGF